MTFYAIFEPKPGKPDLPAAIGDRFSWFACLLPPLFLLRHGLWLQLLGWIVLTLAIRFAALWVGGAASLALHLLLAIAIGFAAPAMRRGKLRRAGWTYRREIWATHHQRAQLEALLP